MTDLLDRVASTDTTLANLLQARYRREGVAEPQAWNPVLDVLLSHRSVRAFQDQPLPAGALEMLIGAAQSAPSSSNLQVWSVVAVEDPKRKAHLAALAGHQRSIVEAPLFLVWLIDLHRLTALAEERGGAHGGLSYLEMFLLGATDTAMAAQNALTALESMGLGAVYIGGIRNHPTEVAATLGLPTRAFALVGMAVGWPAPERPADIKPRLPQASVLFREQYGWGDPQRAAVDSYDETLRGFQREQGMVEQDWSRQAGMRTHDAAALRGREDLRETLHRMGFELK